MRHARASVVLLALAACGGHDDVDPCAASPSMCPPDGGPMMCTPGVPTLTCPEDVLHTCSGALTAVALGEPSVDTTCGAMVGTVTNDAPAAGYPVGATEVTFSAMAEDGSRVSCATTVTVEDVTPPTIACPASGVVVHTEAGVLATPPPVTAEDECDAAPVVTVEPATLVRGINDVVYTATDATGLSDDCSVQIEILEAFAPDGLRIISAEIAG